MLSFKQKERVVLLGDFNARVGKSVDVDDVESEIEYRPPSIIGRVYKICALLGQLLLAPKCSPTSQNLVEK